MRWQYRRVLLPSGEGVQGHRYDGPHPPESIYGAKAEEMARRAHEHALRNARANGIRYDFMGGVNFPDVEDPVEKLMNEIGGEGWELVGVTEIRETQDGRDLKNIEKWRRRLIEYMFKRPAASS